MTRWSVQQVGDWAEYVVAKAASIRRLHGELTQRHRLDAGDGYPVSSLPGHSSPSNEMDDDGTPLPARPSDPTARIAVQNVVDPGSDPLFRVLGFVERSMLDAMRLLEAAEGRAKKVLEPGEAPPEPKDGCSSCARLKTYYPVWRKGLCRFCYDHQDEQGNPPPREAVDVMHRQGARQASAWIARNRRVA